MQSNRPSRTQACHDSLTRFFQRVRNIFTHVIPQYLDAHISGVLTFVEGIKTIIANPTVEGVIDGLAPKIAPEIFNVILANIDKVLEFLGILDHCKNCTSNEEKLKCIADQLATVHPDLQRYLLHAIAVYLTRLTSGDETTTEAELNALVAFAENELQHQANAPAAV
jgi:hypothetical protein